MTTIYRYRPANCETIEEICEGYLWFSKPTAYSDTEDANITAIADANETVKDAFDRVFSDCRVFGDKMKQIGICCFTESKPTKQELRQFPHRGCKGGIVIEYDKNKLEEHFLHCNALGDCFKKVEYLNNPMLLQSSTSNGYDVLWSTDEDGGECYKSLRGDIERDIKVMDEFILRLLTRLNIKYQKQKESRIILAGRNIPKNDPDSKGYKIKYPLDAIMQIYVHPDTPNDYITKLKQVVDDRKISVI